MNRKHAEKTKRTMAQQADRHQLYEESVQCVDAEIDFVDSTFRKLRGRHASLLREDFCATANTACEWVRRRDGNIAYAVDLDASVLEWAQHNRLADLRPDRRDNVRLINENVLQARTEPVDMVLAMNFSYWVMKTREDMIRYFRSVHAGLKEDGVFFMDAFGGYEAFEEMEEETEHDDFTYVWDQYYYNPINGHATCKIHFKFPDGSRIKNAFVYDWRLWTLPELQEILEAAGFEPTVYWEGTDKDGEGNGVFTPTVNGHADAGWIAYIVGKKIA